MEADWEIEIAPDAPMIDASWSGFVDLRNDPNGVANLQEVHQFPLLGSILLRFNGLDPAQIENASAVFWTTKCDLWTPESVDPDEMEATRSESAVAWACYIDLIPEDAALFTSLPELESQARRIVSRLRATPVRCSRIDLILRQAIARGNNGFGITAYTTVCGPDTSNAEQTLEAALDALVKAISSLSTS